MNTKDNSNLDLWSMLKRELTPCTIQCTEISLHHFKYRTNGGKFMLYDKHVIVTGVPDNWNVEFLFEDEGRLEPFEEYENLTNKEMFLKLKQLIIKLSITEKQKTYAEHLLLR